MVYTPTQTEYKEGRSFGGGRLSSPIAPAAGMLFYIRRSPINTWTEAAGHGAIVALDPATGQRKWTFPMHDISTSGILTTASDVLFTGNREGTFHVMDARTGTVLWKLTLGGPIVQGPITYEVGGKQYVATAAGNGLFVFGLRE
jgi:outer membrane protein assembly factor BamB